MEDELRTHSARQGIGSIFMPFRCRVCNYLAVSWSEKTQMIHKSPCPNCGTPGVTSMLGINRYGLVGNWIGEYATSESPRDHVSSVIMFCALTEALLENIIEDYFDLHPEVRLKFKDPERVKIDDVLGDKLPKLLEQAPKDIRDFPDSWKTLREKRNLFLHGKSSNFHIIQTDAFAAMDLVPKAVSVFAWLNNKYCLKQGQ